METQKLIETARAELRNIRQQIETLKRVHKKEVAEVKSFLQKATQLNCSKCGCHTTDQSNLSGDVKTQHHSSVFNESTNGLQDFKPIGHVQSTFKYKNGTPRQPGLCHMSRALLTIGPEVFTNPAHSLEGLEQFSHVWVMFVFHKNNNTFSKAKVKPPRLDGAKMGLFSTRSPYRPNPIGLSLCRIEKIEGATIHLSGVDLLDGTPVLDIKPYIPEYDTVRSLVPTEPSTTFGTRTRLCQAQDKSTGSLPVMFSGDVNAPSEKIPDIHFETPDVQQNAPIIQHQAPNTSLAQDEDCLPTLENSSKSELKPGMVLEPDLKSTAVEVSKTSVAGWLNNPPVSGLNVRFTPVAKEQLLLYNNTADGAKTPRHYRLEHLRDWQEAEAAIRKVLESDPRSPYRRKQCRDRLYFFTVDTIHVTCWFDDNDVEVVKVQPLSLAPALKS